MNAFFVSVEVRENPELVGLPVVVGGSGPRGVIAAASYEARVFGVRSAMPSSTARRLCPNLLFVDGHYSLYQQVSNRIMSIFMSFTPTVEPLSLDEAFLDVSSAARIHGQPEEIAHKIRSTIYKTESLLSTVGVASSKSVAKLASEAAKPRIVAGQITSGTGIKVVRKPDEQAFLNALPVRALWGVGPKTNTKLERLGLKTVGDIAKLPVEVLCGALGEANGHHLHRLAHGNDDRHVEPERSAKSISHEETFETDVTDPAVLHAEIVRMSDAVASRLRSAKLRARTINVKARYGSFETLIRSKTISAPTSNGVQIAEVAAELFDQVDVASGIRLVGVGVKGLSDQSFDQLSLLDGEDGEVQHNRDDVDEVIDEVRRRFGGTAIGPAAAIKESRTASGFTNRRPVIPE